MKEKIIKPKSSASTARILLIVITLIIVAAIIAISIFAKKYLDSYAADTAEQTSKANSFQQSLSDLSNAKAQLNKQHDMVTKAQQIVAESKEYKYQNQIIGDLTAYANQSNMQITGFMFQDPDSKSDSHSKSKVSGLKIANVVIQIGKPMQYKDFLHFLALIENNATRMQIKDVTISPLADTAEDPSSNDKSEGTESNPGMINVSSLNVGVYIK